MGKRSSSFVLIITILVCIGGIIYARNRLDRDFGKVIEIVIAIIGAGFVLFQLHKDHYVTKAEFLYTLSETFSNNHDICEIYKKLKEQRDMGKELVKFTEDDCRKMGDYIMFFEIMGYLVDEVIVSMKVVDKIFANKFFIFMHNEVVKESQLKFDGINAPIIEFYIKWRQYRIKHKLPPLYGDPLVKGLDGIIVEKNKTLFKKATFSYSKRKIPTYQRAYTVMLGIISLENPNSNLALH